MITIEDLIQNKLDCLNEHYIPNTTICFWETADGNWQIADNGLKRAMNKYLYWVDFSELKYRVKVEFNFPSLQAALDAYNKTVQQHA